MWHSHLINKKNPIVRSLDRLIFMIPLMSSPSLQRLESRKSHQLGKGNLPPHFMWSHACKARRNHLSLVGQTPLNPIKPQLNAINTHQTPWNDAFSDTQMKHAGYISLPYHPHDMPIYHQLPAGNWNSHGKSPLDSEANHRTQWERKSVRSRQYSPYFCWWNPQIHHHQNPV